MTEKCQAVLFDLDGTLIDTAPDFIRIIKVMCAKHQHPAPSDNAIREQVSAGARAMVKLMFGELAHVTEDDPNLLAYRQEFWTPMRLISVSIVACLMGLMTC